MVRITRYVFRVDGAGKALRAKHRPKKNRTAVEILPASYTVTVARSVAFLHHLHQKGTAHYGCSKICIHVVKRMRFPNSYGDKKIEK